MDYFVVSSPPDFNSKGLIDTFVLNFYSASKKLSFILKKRYFHFCKMKIFILLYIVAVSVVYAGHFYNADGTPYDAYHYLHIPHNPPLYPTYHRVPNTGFSCYGLGDQLWSDIATGCQAYHLCQGQRLLSSNLCGNGTLFNQQFQVCDQFYNVRCGSPYEDL